MTTAINIKDKRIPDRHICMIYKHGTAVIPGIT